MSSFWKTSKGLTVIVSSGLVSPNIMTVALWPAIWMACSMVTGLPPHSITTSTLPTPSCSRRAGTSSRMESIARSAPSLRRNLALALDRLEQNDFGCTSVFGKLHHEQTDHCHRR